MLLLESEEKKLPFVHRTTFEFTAGCERLDSNPTESQSIPEKTEDLIILGHPRDRAKQFVSASSLFLSLSQTLYLSLSDYSY